MHVLSFFLLVLHILVMCVNYSCTCGCELKYHSKPQFLSLVKTLKGFKPFVFVAGWCLLAAVPEVKINCSEERK